MKVQAVRQAENTYSGSKKKKKFHVISVTTAVTTLYSWNTLRPMWVEPKDNKYLQLNVKDDSFSEVALINSSEYPQITHDVTKG